MQKCYLTSLPREAMRTLAGFEPAKGSYFLARASVEPPVNLLSQIFSQVEMWQESINSGRCEQTIAAGGFLELLQYLRKVLLQDAVLMSDMAPQHSIWRHPLFQSTEFLEYRSEAKRAIRETENPAEQRLQKAMPVLSAKIDGVHHDLKTRVEKMGNTLQAVKSSLAGVINLLAPVSTGPAVLQVKLLGPGQTTQPTPSPTSSTPSAGGAEPTPEPVHYKMSRGINSVWALWKEWKIGLDGADPIEKLETQYSTKWCDADERRFFNRRRQILDLVVEITELIRRSGVNDESEAAMKAVRTMDTLRQRKKKTLNWITNNAELFGSEVKMIVQDDNRVSHLQFGSTLP